MTMAKTKTKKSKHWSYSAGERGRNRVRAFEHVVTGLLFLEWHEDVGGKLQRKRMALSHRDRNRGKQQADAAAAALSKGTSLRPERPSLQELFDIYEREVTPTKGMS